MLNVNTIIDNSCEALSMVKTIKDLIDKPEVNKIKIATGFWDLKAVVMLYKELKIFLERVDAELYFLIGKDPYVYQSMVNNPKYVDCKCTEDFISVQINELDLKPEYEEAVQLFMDYAIGENPKIQIRLYNKNENNEQQFFHSKCYIFLSEDNAYGIVGSSNFTEKGLLGNSEVNYLEIQSMFVMAEPKPHSKAIGHNYWFDQKWKMAEDWNKTFLEQVLRKSKFAPKVKKPDNPVEDPVITPLTPHEVYIKYLQEQFGDIASTDVQEQIKSYLPKSFKSLSYQIDAVQQCFYIMKQYHGFILADVVGLGKTMVGLLVVKKFIMETQRNNKVLIIVPPAILPGWKETLETLDKDAKNPISDNIDFITTGRVYGMAGEVAEEDIVSDEFDTDFSDNNYGLIIIDESHNFRNSDTQKYHALDSLIDSICASNGEYPYIGLLSATPQNNSPQDLKNQIYLFQRTPLKSDFSDIEGNNLSGFFTLQQRRYNICRSVNYEEYFKFQDVKDEVDKRLESYFDGDIPDFGTEDDLRAFVSDKLINIATDIREKVLDHIVVRRTRKDIKKYYADDAQGLNFPEPKGPNEIKYKMSEKLSRLFARTVDTIIHDKDWKEGDKYTLGFYRYSAIVYLRDEFKSDYEKKNLTVERIANQLSFIESTLLVKRLESSFSAFRQSLRNLRQYTRNMMVMLEKDCVFICPDLDVNAIFAKFDYDFGKVKVHIEGKIKQKPNTNNRKYKAKDFRDCYKDYLQHDLDLLDELIREWDAEHSDPKFQAFTKCVYKDLFNPAVNNPSGNDKPRLVIFTEALATQKAIVDFFENDGEHKVLAISAKNAKDYRGIIKANFDANCPDDEKRDDYDVIVTTEVLAEGVNLHRSNVILNYDTPWNATKLMQRIGRVNRLGSKEKFYYVFNFFPSSESDKLINLVAKAYAKLQAFHTMFGEDAKVYSNEEQLTDVNYAKSVDDAESPFARYINELKEYHNNNPERYDEIKAMPFDNIGGQLTMNMNNTACFVVRAQHRKNANIIVVNSDAEDAGTRSAKVVSVLQFLEALRQDDYDFCDYIDVDENRFKVLQDMAFNEYNQFVNLGIKNADLKNRQKDALKIADKIMDLVEGNKELRKLVKNASKMVEKGNSYAINAFLSYEREYMTDSPSLFGVEYDIDSIVKSMFSSLAQQAEKKYGAPYLALYNY